jgi:hypothetical protein
MNNESLQELLRQVNFCRDQLHTDECIVNIKVVEDVLSFKIVLWDGIQGHHIDVACSLTALRQCRIDLLVAIFETQLAKLREAVDNVG